MLRLAALAALSVILILFRVSLTSHNWFTLCILYVCRLAKALNWKGHFLKAQEYVDIANMLDASDPDIRKLYDEVSFPFDGVFL